MFFRLDCQGLHGQLSPTHHASLKLPPLPLSLSCCRQTINQCFASWTAHIYCSCWAQQKGKINKDKANPLNWQSRGRADGWVTMVPFVNLLFKSWWAFTRRLKERLKVAQVKGLGLRTRRIIRQLWPRWTWEQILLNRKITYNNCCDWSFSLRISCCNQWHFTQFYAAMWPDT